MTAWDSPISTEPTIKQAIDLLVSVFGTSTSLTLLAIGTALDPTNPFTAKLNSALMTAKTVAEGGTGDLRYTLSKESVAKTLSLLFQTNFSGRAEIGLTGDDNLHVKVSPDGATFTEAMNVDKTTGAVALPRTSLGFRNLVINGSFRINQRAYVSGSARVANAFAHDRWRAGAGGATYTFVQTAPHTTINITAGTLQQVIENLNVDGGDYVVSWLGTATAKVNGGAFAGSPFIVNLPAGVVATIEFGTGTVGLVMCEPGRVAGVFENRPAGVEFDLCRRYFRLNSEAIGAWFVGGGVSAQAQISVDYAGMRDGFPSVALVNSNIIIADPGVANVVFSAASMSPNNIGATSATLNFGVGGGTQAGTPIAYHVAILTTSQAVSITKEL